MLARQSLGVPGTAIFLPFGAMILPCFFPFMYRHPVLTSVRTKAATSLLLLYRMVRVGSGILSDATPFVITWSPWLRRLDWSQRHVVLRRQNYLLSLARHLPLQSPIGCVQQLGWSLELTWLET